MIVDGVLVLTPGHDLKLQIWDWEWTSRHLMLFNMNHFWTYIPMHSRWEEEGRSGKGFVPATHALLLARQEKWHCGTRPCYYSSAGLRKKLKTQTTRASHVGLWCMFSKQIMGISTAWQADSGWNETTTLSEIEFLRSTVQAYLARSALKSRPATVSHTPCRTETVKAAQ